MKKEDFGVCKICRSTVPKSQWRTHYKTHEETMYDKWEPKNDGLLKGFVCPKCGSEGPFDIVAERIECVRDDRNEDLNSETEWDCDSRCWCGNCNYEGTVKDFVLEDE